MDQGTAYGLAPATSDRELTEVGTEADRVPVAAQQLAHRRAGADLGQLAVVRRRREAVGGALIVLSGLAPEALM